MYAGITVPGEIEVAMVREVEDGRAGRRRRVLDRQLVLLGEGIDDAYV